MRVFLTGASGYIGSAVAEVLRKRGHQVVGLVRTEPARERLKERGMSGVVGTLADLDLLANAAREAEGVIHTASTNGPDAPQADRAAVQAMLGALEGSGKPFVYTSGVWVHGNTGDRPATEESPLAPTPLMAWRPAVEQLVRDAAAKGVRSVVVRPAIVYGHGGGIVAMFSNAARQDGIVKVVGTDRTRWSFVHVEDLADLYVLLLEQAKPGSVYLAAHGPAIVVKAVAEAAARAASPSARVELWPVEQALAQLGPFADALALDQQISGEKAERDLAWSPGRPSVLEDLAAR
jgi:nucleoside-diphosphate-sugar epimerase